MKYIDAKKLKAEIERYENTAIDAYNPHGEDADFWHGKVVACEDIKAIVTPLHQEQPKVDLEKELKTIRESDEWRQMQKRGSYMIEALLAVARHFYELGLRRAAEMYDDIEYKRQRAEEEVPKDLEEAAMKAYPSKSQKFISAFGTFEFDKHKPERDAFIAGAEWMANQMPLPEDTVIFQKGVEEGKRLMMEDALEGVAHPDDCEIWVNLVGYGYDIKDGDKVKAIIVKEDEK